MVIIAIIPARERERAPSILMQQRATATDQLLVGYKNLYGQLFRFTVFYGNLDP